MSVVTNLMVKVHPGDDFCGMLTSINTFFTSGDDLVSCDDDRLPRGWYGGTKMLECAIYVGAYNHLDIQAFIEHVKLLSFRYRHCVQILYQEQEAHRLTVVDVFDDG